MKLSIIVATRNRHYAIIECLDSIVASLKLSSLSNAEIIVVDNGSTDNTTAVIAEWAKTCPISFQALYEPIIGLSRAQNKALKVAKGELIAITDDDCRLEVEYINDLLRHYEEDTEIVLRGGRIALGDESDLPLTINVSLIRKQWRKDKNSARHDGIPGQLNGCNMTMSKTVIERIGFFNEDFGPGGYIGSGADSDYFYRAYLAGIILEYVPDMVVFHCHGRKTADEGYRLLRKYMIADGALCARYFFKDCNLCRSSLWDIKGALREIRANKNLFLPLIGYSYKNKVIHSMCGVAKYWWMLLKS